MLSNVFTLGLVALLAAVPNVVADCSGPKGLIKDCCWGGTDNQAACSRQKNSYACFMSQQGNYCEHNGVTPEQCDADCCSISEKIGIGCPK